MSRAKCVTCAEANRGRLKAEAEVTELAWAADAIVHALKLALSESDDARLRHVAQIIVATGRAPKRKL